MQQRHKGTEFSNVKRVWEENERSSDTPKEIEREGNEFSNVSDTWEQNEKNVSAPSRKEDDIVNQEESERKNDYWDRVATDPANGYKNEGAEKSQLNSDQQAGDNDRGD